MSQPTRILELSTTKEKDNVQQYVEVGSNIFLGTKDGMKYTLIQTQDNKYRLVETVSALSTDSKGSFETSVKDEASVAIENIMPSGGHKAIKLTPLKFEPSPCQGQGDEIENPILTSCSLSDFKESDISLENVSAAKNEDDIDSTSQLTYTTLLPRQEKEQAVSNICYSTPSSSYYSSPPIFSTPISTRSSRGTKKQKIQLIPVGASYSPIPRLRVDAPKQRRPRHTMFQYMPHTSHSSNTSSSNASESKFSVTASSSSGFSARSFSKGQSSFEIPRVPNNTPTSPQDDVLDKQKALNMQWMPQIVNRVEEYIGLDPRESHNEKERKRRLRIKNACQFMRTLLPCISEKTDNATVFERAANYIAFIRDTVGNELDMVGQRPSQTKNLSKRQVSDIPLFVWDRRCRARKQKVKARIQAIFTQKDFLAIEKFITHISP